MVAIIFFMSIALSIDALSIGISYSVRGIRIPLTTKFVIAGMTGLLMFFAICLGELLNHMLAPEIAEIVGAGALIIIGIAFIQSSLFGGEDSTYDFNHSRDIDLKEGALLAIALSADSVSAGVAASASGMNCWLISFSVGITHFIFLFLGVFLARHIKLLEHMSSKLGGIVSGSILILIGILRFVC